MYMYYLLGHKLMELPISVDRREVLAENAYLLTLDGDIDFQPPVVTKPGVYCGLIQAAAAWLQQSGEPGRIAGCLLLIPAHPQVWPETRFGATRDDSNLGYLVGTEMLCTKAGLTSNRAGDPPLAAETSSEAGTTRTRPRGRPGRGRWGGTPRASRGGFEDGFRTA
jgi:hypothetical protein